MKSSDHHPDSRSDPDSTTVLEQWEAASGKSRFRHDGQDLAATIGEWVGPTQLRGQVWMQRCTERQPGPQVNAFAPAVGAYDDIMPTRAVIVHDLEQARSATRYVHPGIAGLVPHRLELKPRGDLLAWLEDLTN